jgi:lactoylglutathione lyase
MGAHPRLMHTMLHVSDMDRAVAFYCGLLGMTVQVSRENPETQHRNVFLGYGPYDTTPQVEFVSYGVGRHYERGDAFGHLAIGVDDIVAFCDRLRATGAVISREPKSVPSGAKIAFIRDPDGYEIELIEPAPAPLPMNPPCTEMDCPVT